MNRKDEIAFNLATSPIGIKNIASLLILQKLEEKYPFNPKIQIKIVNFYLENQMEEKAIFKLFKIIRNDSKRKREQEFNNNYNKDHNNKDYDYDYNYNKDHNNKDYDYNYNKDHNNKDLIISEMISKFIFLSFKYEFSDFISNSFFLNYFQFYETASQLLKNKKPEIDFEKFIFKNKNNFIYKEISDYSYEFNWEYSKLIEIIQEGTFPEFIKLSTKIFRVENIVELIDHLIKQQKLEILLLLSKRYAFFEKYYEIAVVEASQEIISVIELALTTKNLKVLSGLSEILKNK